MKDSKSLFLLVFALVLITVSFILISVWGYHFYFHADNGESIAQSSEKTPLFMQKIATRDSLQNILDSTVNQLGVQQVLPASDSKDSMDKAIEMKLLEYNRLKGEITGMLRKKTSSGDAGEKMDELQHSIDELKNQNNKVALENARLNKMLQQILLQNKQKGKNASSGTDTKNVQSATGFTLPLLVSHLRFSATVSGSDVVNSSGTSFLTGKLEGSFQINILSDKYNSPAIYIVIWQPNGKVLLNSAWESGNFGTTSGSQVYSALLHFENKDNNNRLGFSMNSGKFQKGVYIMEIYHNGIVIGRLKKKLF
ncbi:MAG: hypothetical protein ABI237_18475 [Ginsengibacter sp.]